MTRDYRNLRSKVALGATFERRIRRKGGLGEAGRLNDD